MCNLVRVFIIYNETSVFLPLDCFQLSSVAIWTVRGNKQDHPLKKTPIIPRLMADIFQPSTRIICRYFCIIIHQQYKNNDFKLLILSICKMSPLLKI